MGSLVAFVKASAVTVTTGRGIGAGRGPGAGAGVGTVGTPTGGKATNDSLDMLPSNEVVVIATINGVYIQLCASQTW